MTEEKDPLAGEISVAAKLDEAGLTAQARSRAFVALDRLIGSAIDIPGALIEGVSRRLRLRNEAIERLMEAETEAAVKLLTEHPDAGERTLRRFLQEQERKQQNRDAIARETIEQLKLPPPPLADSAAQSKGANQDEAISEDWLNVFSSHADNATSEHLRSLWARILAGEIRQPGAFSLTTLRTLSELDQQIATMFEREVVDRFQQGLLPKSEALIDQVLLDLTFLEEVGLLQDVNGTLAMEVKPGPDGYGHISNGKYALRIRTKTPHPVQLPVIKITRVGREIASILPAEPEDRCLRKAAELLRPKVHSIELCLIGSVTANGSRTIAASETL